MTAPLPTGRARVETIAPPSGQPFLHAAAGDGWVLAVDGGGVVVWSEETGYRQEPKHPPFVTRVDACPGGFVLFADDGGMYYAGFYFYFVTTKTLIPSGLRPIFRGRRPARSEWRGR